MTTITIIGAGVTGLSLLLLLQESGADLSTVTVIDPYFDGGDLSRKWTAVESNTPWSKTIRALATNCPSLKLDTPSENTTKLVEIGHLLRSLAARALKQVKQIQGTALSADYSSDTNKWTVTVQTAGKILEVLTKRIILAPGGEPKSFDLNIPSIPLEIAIDATRLQHIIRPNDHVLVFGTMHSGTLVMRNLVSTGATVVGFHYRPEPFYWDRDGDYDGIKGEAAAIADDIISGKIPVTLVQTSDINSVIRNSQGANWVVYAMGFQPRLVKLTVNGEQKSSKEYDGANGKLAHVPAAWGFGIAYPNVAPDGIHWDVSVAAFLDHMKPQLPEILQP